MSVLDRFRHSESESDSVETDTGQEQLAADDPVPRGESRDSGWMVSVFGDTGWFRTPTSQSVIDTTDDTDEEIETVKSPPPDDLAEDHTAYFEDTEFTRAALKIFALVVTEPGYNIDATVEQDTGETDENGEPVTETVTDDEMQTTLREWAEQCAIDACEAGKDLSVLLKQAPILRYSKGTGFLEKVGTNADPDTLAALVYHKPETFVQYKRANKSMLVQPDDDVHDKHPRTPDGDAAAYVQYDDALYFEDNAIAFAADELVKLTFDAANGSAWGTPLWNACGDRIDALYQKLTDRDASIRTVGHAHRIYSSENWTQQQAQDYATQHKEGSVSAGPNVDDHSDDSEGYAESFAGRVDFVSDKIDVQAVQGDVADIDSAVKDDIEAIFSVLPVSKSKVAYSQDVNQFSIEVLDALDSRLVDEERQYLSRIFTPIIEEKADELAGGEYDGSIEFHVQPGEADNVLDREDFPAENLSAFTSSLKDLLDAGASPELIDAVLSNVGIGRDEIEDEVGDRYTVDPLDEDNEHVQQQFSAMNEETESDSEPAE